VLGHYRARRAGPLGFAKPRVGVEVPEEGAPGVPTTEPNSDSRKRSLISCGSEVSILLETTEGRIDLTSFKNGPDEDAYTIRSLTGDVEGQE
jgi:hypothetical protein